MSWLSIFLWPLTRVCNVGKVCFKIWHQSLSPEVVRKFWFEVCFTQGHKLMCMFHKLVIKFWSNVIWAVCVAVATFILTDYKPAWHNAINRFLHISQVTDAIVIWYSLYYAVENMNSHVLANTICFSAMSFMNWPQVSLINCKECC
jgi:hypothetical protein